MKKKLFIAIILLGVGGVIYLLYTFFFTPKAPQGDVNDPVINNNNFPISGSTTFPVSREIGTGSETSFIEDEDLRYRILENQPVAGYIPTKERGELGQRIYYTLRSTGNVYTTFIESGSPSRLTNTTIPRIQNATFVDSGTHVIFQFLSPYFESFETYLGFMERRTPEDMSTTDPEDQTPYKIEGEFLPRDIITYDISPDGAKLFYIRKVDTGSEGIVLTIDGSSSVSVFRSSVQGWLAKWSKDDEIILTTKPSGEAPGYVYSLNPTTKTLSKIVGDIPGLTVHTHPSLDLMVYGEYSVPNQLGLVVLNTQTKNTTRLGIATLPDKCVWDTLGITLYCAVPRTIPPNIYPDGWYQGVVSFEDVFVSVHAETGEIQHIFTPSDYGLPGIDAIDLNLSDDGRYILFINKKDYSLWSIRI